MIVFAINYFAEIEFPISERYRFHGLLRRVNKSSNDITSFSDIPIEIDKTPITPTGKLGSYYFVIGLKYTWR